MASPEAETINSTFRSFRESYVDGPATIEEIREGVAGLARLATEPEGVSYTAVDIDGVPAFWADPEGCAHDRVLVVLHGGGYISGSAESHLKLAGHLARAVGCRALVVDYRLAPEHPFPAAIDDATVAVRWLLAEGFDASKIAIYGDSAGGGLALATLLRLRDGGVTLLAACVLCSPWLDLLGTGESITTRAERDLLLTADGMRMGRLYYGEHDPRDPLVSPVYADLTGLPPLYIQVGDEEILLDDSTRLASNAQRDDVVVRLDIFPEMQHVFLFSVGNMPEADDAVHRIGAWLLPHFGHAAVAQG